MSRSVHIAFEREIVTLSLAEILPRRATSERVKRTEKYKRILKSIEEVGVIEPLVVSRLNKRDKRFMLLDGHLRLNIIAELGQREARCLVADDDEAFTYNKRVSRLATVQEHFMLLRAINRGVPEEKLARALNVDIRQIKRKKVLLDGICPEAVELLKDKNVNTATFDTLRKMKPLRQMEAAELMITAGNWTASYAKALLAGTKQNELARPDQPKRIAGLNSEQMARMEREMSTLHQDFKQLESSYGDDTLHLVIAVGYLAKLLANAEIEQFLTIHHSEILNEFRAIIAATSLDQASQAA